MKGSVLVVDNERANRLLIVKALQLNGYECDEADGCQSAKEKLRAVEYDVLLTDKNMPFEGKGSEGGMNLIRWVRQNKPDLAFIVMTGYPTVDSAVEALQLGAFDYLLKPLEIKLLLQKVDRVCEYRKSVNPEAAMGAYLKLSRDIMTATAGNAADMTACLAKVQDRLNQIFQVFRSVERVLLEHRQRLAEIAAYVEQAREELPPDNPLSEMLQRIAEKAAQRL